MAAISDRRAAILLSLVSVLSLVIIVTAAESQVATSSEHHQIQPAAANKTKLQARILLETNDSLDIADQDQRQSANHSQELEPNSSKPTTTARPRKRVSKKRSRLNGNGEQLSNIWSMFLPSSASQISDDYGDETSDAGASEDDRSTAADLTLDSSASSSSTNSTIAIAANLENDDSEADDGRSRPSSVHTAEKQQENAGAPTDGAAAAAAEKLASSSGGGGARNRTEQQLLTGALSKSDIGGLNMNDIVSNIMGSMSNGTAAAAANRSTSSKRDSTEREENRSSVAAAAAPSGDNGDNFERWLNRIKFHDGAIASSSSSTRRPSGKQQAVGLPSASPLAFDSREEAIAASNSRHASSAALMQSASLAGPRAKQSNAAAGQPSSQAAAAAASTKFAGLFQTKSHQQQQQQPANRRTSMQQDDFSLKQFQQHPFQQHQLRQSSSSGRLLQHRHHHPPSSAQASTISVSTQDGASNTSLSLAGAQPFNPTLSLIGQIPPVRDQISLTINSTTATAGNGSSSDQPANLEQQQQQQIYQSQDEILRQVTSAINFEQQLNHKKREQENEIGGRDQAAANNGLATGNSNSNEDARLVKDDSGAAAAAIKLTLLNQTNAEESIDKSFDLLAEKLRLLALQQQQFDYANSSQPTWLRRPPLQQAAAAAMANANANANASSLAAALAANSTNSKSLEQLLDLLTKHDSAKASQEAQQQQQQHLANLQHLSKMDNSRRQLQQLTLAADKLRQQHQQQQQQRQSANQAAIDQVSSSLIRIPFNDDGGGGGGEDEVNTAPGPNNGGGSWTPVVQPAVNSNDMKSLPPSPANLAKQRQRQHYQQQQHRPLMHISQLKDNVGFSDDFANDDYYLNNLSMMFAHTSDGRQPTVGASGQQERLFGLPIALLKDDSEQQQQQSIELPPGQLEAAAIAAAEQLVGQHNAAAHRDSQPLVGPHAWLRPAGAGIDEANRRGQQQVEPINQIQKLLQQYSPQTFAAHGVGPRAPPFGAGVGVAGEPASRARQSMGQGHLEPPPPAPSMGDVASLLHHDQKQADQASLFANEGKPASMGNHLMGPEVQLMSHQLNRPGQADQLVAGRQPARPDVGFNYGLDGGARSGFHDDLMRAQQQQQQQQLQQSNENQSQQAPRPSQQQQLSRQQPRPAERQHQQPLPPPPPPNANPTHGYGHGHFVEYPPHPTVVRQFNGPNFYSGRSQPLNGGPPQMITTTLISNGAGGGAAQLPVRIREVNLPRPFGFRSHHSVAYQASPAISALLPSLMGQSAVAASRPGLLRHMSPLRATLNQGQRFLGAGGLLAPPGHLHYSPHPGHSMRESFAYGTPLFNLGPAGRYHQPAAAMRQLKRHSDGAAPDSSAGAGNKWRSKMPPANTHSAASKMNARHSDPSIVLLEEGEEEEEIIGRPAPASHHSRQFGYERFEEFIQQAPDKDQHQPQEGASIKSNQSPRKPQGYPTKTSIQSKTPLAGPSAAQATFRHQRGRHFDGPPQIQIDRPSVPKIKPTCEPSKPTAMSPAPPPPPPTTSSTFASTVSTFVESPHSVPDSTVLTRESPTMAPSNQTLADSTNAANAMTPPPPPIVSTIASTGGIASNASTTQSGQESPR